MSKEKNRWSPSSFQSLGYLVSFVENEKMKASIRSRHERQLKSRAVCRLNLSWLINTSLRVLRHQVNDITHFDAYVFSQPDLQQMLRDYWAVMIYDFKILQLTSKTCRIFDSSLSNLVDPASSHMLVSKIKPCKSKYKLLYGKTANSSLQQL